VSAAPSGGVAGKSTTDSRLHSITIHLATVFTIKHLNFTLRLCAL
jgi:hypothetical protein